MTIDHPRPLQFSLKHIFGLTTLVAILLWLLPAAARTQLPFAPYYVLFGVVQLACAAVMYQQWRTHGPLRAKPQEQPYELALLGTVVTLATWALTLMCTFSALVGIGNKESPGFLMPLTVASVVLHLPILWLQILGLFVMRRRLHHAALMGLLLLNILNTLVVFGMVVSLFDRAISGMAPPG